MPEHNSDPQMLASRQIFRWSNYCI